MPESKDALNKEVVALPSLDSLRTGIFILARLVSLKTLHRDNRCGLRKGGIYKLHKGVSMWYIEHKGTTVDLVMAEDIVLTRVLT